MPLPHLWRSDITLQTAFLFLKGMLSFSDRLYSTPIAGEKSKASAIIDTESNDKLLKFCVINESYQENILGAKGHPISHPITVSTAFIASAAELVIPPV
jgi:hypothetical protein